MNPMAMISLTNSPFLMGPIIFYLALNYASYKKESELSKGKTFI